MYCTVQDVADRMSDESLRMFTDDENLGEPDFEKVETAIDDASVLINGYLVGTYEIPLSEIPPIVQQHCISLAVYNLTFRRHYMKMPEGLVSERKEIIRFFERVQSGAIPLYKKTPDTETGRFPGKAYSYNRGKKMPFAEMIKKMPP